MERPESLSNWDLAEGRLKNCTKRLTSQGKFNEYDQVFKEWQSEGITEPVSKSESQHNPVHYLPHHPVESSETTKITPVFDTSTKDKNSVLLNNCLEKGSNSVELIPKILNRLHRTEVIISKEYFYKSVLLSYRNFLQFL